MVADKSCAFCNVVAGQIPSFKLYEDSETLAFLDINPVHDGHSLVISKSHYSDVFSIEPDVFAAVARTTLRVATAVNAAMAPDGLNLVQSNGPGAAQSVPHFHLHIVPRRHGDHLLVNWQLKPGDMSRLKEIAERIRAKL
jgi:histidine triad (HIT) family protein